MMTLPLPVVAVAMLFGMCCSLFLACLPAQNIILVALVISLLLLYITSKRLVSIFAYILLGCALVAWHATQHFAHLLPTNMEGDKITVIGTISSVVENQKKPSCKFNMQVSEVYNNYAGWRLPATVQLSWRSARNIQPGDIWRLRVKLKKPRNYANPGSFDTERYYLQQRIVALGYVIDDPQNHKLRSNTVLYPINYLSQRLKDFLHTNLRTEYLYPILLSLLVGIRSNIAPELYEVLQNTGTAHLLAISGLHLGSLAAVVFVLIRILWRWIPKQFVKITAKNLAAICALIVCGIYALIAGFSIATQRSFIMLSVVLLGIAFKRKVSSWQGYYLALLLIIIWDPLAILSFGFWFSFLAVGLLLYALQQRRQLVQPWYRLYQWLQPQIVLTVGLLPCSLLFFSKVAYVGPVANLIAVPWVSLAVLPLGLLAILMIPVFPSLGIVLLKAASFSLSYLWLVLQKLSNIPMYVWTLPDKHLPILVLSAVFGLIWLFAPRGIPGRWLGILGFIPWLFVAPVNIPYGQAEMALLDVGQGLAAVIRTQNHVLVYDTGAKLNNDFDLGSRVVVPYLASVGAKKIDILMLSHGDNDHAGGAAGVLSKFATHNIVASDTDLPLNQEIKACIAGQSWRWDGVTFTVLHPEFEPYYRKSNDRSCVLMVQAGAHKALLTGDIEKNVERKLVSYYAAELEADVMLVPHHGSKTSSSQQFIEAIKPEYALIPVGYKNQYGHPKAEVVQRYTQQGIKLLNTAEDGAIILRLGASHIQPQAYKHTHRRFWKH